MIDINIETMTTDDIFSIEKDFLVTFDNFWSFDNLKNDFESTNSRYIVAKSNKEILGFAGIKIILDEAEIMNIAVRTDKRNNGIGSLLLEKLISIATDSNCTTIHLEVNEENVQAIHLYEKYNFDRIGLRKNYYNNTNDAILMKKTI